MDIHTHSLKNWAGYGAYGSNMNQRQMSKRTIGEAEVVGSGLLHGWQLAFRRGVLTIEPDAEESVPLAFWFISPRAKTALDHYEGAPHLYQGLQRSANEVKPLSGTCPEDFLIYAMTPEGVRLIDRPDWPSEGYFETCVQGYLDFGLEDWLWVLEAARERSTGRTPLLLRSVVDGSVICGSLTWGCSPLWMKTHGERIEQWRTENGIPATLRSMDLLYKKMLESGSWERIDSSDAFKQSGG